MKKSKGFSLVEVLIAIVILASSVTVIALLWSSNSVRINKAKLYNQVGFLLEKKIIELELQYEGVSIDQIPEELSGNFGDEYKNYRWEFKSQPFEMPNLTDLFLSKDDSQSANETLMTVLNQMKDYLSKTIVEAKITVVVKTNKKDAKFSVTTYFVDYNQQFNLGGG